MIRPAAAACFLALAAPVAVSAPTLCHEKDAQTIFSCQIGSKVASVCASRESGVAAPTLQYRFGAIGKKPEFQFPENPSDGPKRMTFTSYGAAKWESRNIRFVNDGYSYLVTSYSSALEEPDATIMVRGGAQACVILSCKAGFTDAMHALDSLNLPEAPPAELRRTCRNHGNS